MAATLGVTTATGAEGAVSTVVILKMPPAEPNQRTLPAMSRANGPGLVRPEATTVTMLSVLTLQMRPPVYSLKYRLPP
ncbi:hypothetical protein D3C72_1507240 [compost metagenome]